MIETVYTFLIWPIQNSNDVTCATTASEVTTYGRIEICILFIIIIIIIDMYIIYYYYYNCQLLYSYGMKNPVYMCILSNLIFRLLRAVFQHI